MARLDRYFPVGENPQEEPKKEINMDEIANVIKVQIDNALKSALDNKEKEKEKYDNNFESKQGTDKEGEVPTDAESCNRDRSEFE